MNFLKISALCVCCTFKLGTCCRFPIISFHFIYRVFSESKEFSGNVTKSREKWRWVRKWCQLQLTVYSHISLRSKCSSLCPYVWTYACVGHVPVSHDHWRQWGGSCSSVVVFPSPPLSSPCLSVFLSLSIIPPLIPPSPLIRLVCIQTLWRLSCLLSLVHFWPSPQKTMTFHTKNLKAYKKPFLM